MKKIYILYMAFAMILPLQAQEPDTVKELEVPVVMESATAEEETITAETELSEIEESASENIKATPYGDTVNVLDKVEVIETPENTRVTIGENEVIIVEENGDTVRVVLGSRGLSIVEGENGTEIKVMDMDEISEKRHRSRKKRFRPHYAGFELGLSNYMTRDWSLVLPANEQFMDLNTGRSWNWNINPVDFGIGLGTSYVGLASGMGFEFSYYNFEGQNGIMKDPITNDIVEYDPTYSANITRSRLHTGFISVPVLLEFQIPTAGGGRVYLSGGVMGSAKLWSSTNIKYKISGDKSKEKTKGDFNLTPFRYGFTVRAGYRNFGLYANYMMTPFFKATTGPELIPFSMGIAFTW